MIRSAIKEANNSSFRFRLGAVIAKGGRILASGHNKINCHTKDSEFDFSRHAEVSCIYKLLKHNRLDSLNGATLYVTRIGKDGELRSSFPCRRCMELIESVGIRKVVYCDNEGEIKEYKIR